jgi:molecular chaperone Hsp33
MTNDTLQRFIFTTTHIRGEIVRLDDSYQAIFDRHPYPLPVRKLLGEALTATALLSAILKFEGTLTLQIQSDGPIKLLVTQSDEKFHLRGLAQWQEDASDAELAQPLGQGQLALTITPKQGERYQGIVALTGDNLAAALQNYFHQSEQLPTFLFLCTNKTAAAGMLLQLMPDDRSQEKYDFWEHVQHLAHTLTAKELLELDNQQILKRLFHEETLRLFDPEPVTFRCTCSIERMGRALLLMDRAELQDLLRVEKQVVVTCEFCNNQYVFDQATVNQILEQLSS